MSVTTRPAKMEDLKELQSLFVETIRSTCREDYNEEQIEVWTSSVQNVEKWRNKITRQFFIVAEFNNTIVGFSSLDKGDYIDMMYVHKDHLRKGIANLLYKQLQTAAKDLGHKALKADVSKTARPFFEKKGFVVIRENEIDLKGVKITNYHMAQ